MQVSVIEYRKGEDPRAVINRRLADDAARVEVFGNRVLIATSPVLTASAGGIIFTDKTKNEERFQGKVGLILKVGPVAFKYDGSYPWEGPVPVVGDWVFYRASDTWECAIGGVSCRFIDDSMIVGRIPEPELIW